MNPPYLRQEKIHELKDFGVTKDICWRIEFIKTFKKSQLIHVFILKL